jgi:TPR repeat protein
VIPAPPRHRDGKLCLPVDGYRRSKFLARLLVLVGIVIATMGPLAAAPNDGVAPAEADGFMARLQSYAASIAAGASAGLQTVAPSAEGGLGTFEALIGDAYYYGHGVSRDYTEAARWYRRAAQNSNAMAQSTLGDIYYYGRGVPQDFVEAGQWWQLAAERGVAVAQLNLGVMYANGDGVPQDYVKSHLYSNLAAAHLPPGKDRDIAVKNREIVSKLMSPAQITEAQQLARAWRPKLPQ